MILKDFLVNGKIYLNAVSNEMVMCVYVLCPLGYQYVLQYEYLSKVINVHWNGVFNKTTHKQWNLIDK